MRVSSVLAKLKEAGFDVSRMSISACSAASVLRLVEQKGEMILPITLVNNFPMITGRYPSNDEMKQILSVPDGIIETLGLRDTQYKQTAKYGHFGIEGLPWEKTDKAEDLKKYLKN